MRKRRTIKQQWANRRNAKRVWNGIVRKLSGKSIEPDVPEEDAWDRHERHMKPIRQAQQKVVKLSDEEIRQQIEGGG